MGLIDLGRRLSFPFSLDGGKAFRSLALCAVLSLCATPAMAHTGHPEGGFTAGLLHPYIGLDHLLAMAAVGLWAGLVFRKQAFVWPLTFTAFMLTGFAYAIAGGALPGAEWIIGGSVVALGMAAGFKLKAPLLAGCGMTALFALAHGFAHGTEVPAGANPAAFVAGFALATLSLHLIGLLAAYGARRINRPALASLAGFGVAAAGLALVAAG